MAERPVLATMTGATRDYGDVRIKEEAAGVDLATRMLHPHDFDLLIEAGSLVTYYRASRSRPRTGAHLLATPRCSAAR